MERAELARLLGGGSAERGVRSAERTLIAEPDQRRFMTAFAQAVAGKAEIFLCDPKWGAAERAQVDALLQSSPAACSAAAKAAGQTPGAQQSATGRPERDASDFPQGYLMIPTGGTGGRVRFARHDAATIAAAVRGFTRHFGLSQVNAAGLLPLHHVSGLMAWMRCALTGGDYLPLDWKAIEGGALPPLPVMMHGWVLSLVPTQLERLLRHDAAVEWLRKFRIIFIGGAPTWPELLDKGAALRLPISPGYGMTESAAMVAALRPEEFLAGARSCGSVMPHVTVQISGDSDISVSGESLFRGYYPQRRAGGDFATEDCGYLDENGHLHVTGRRDAVIITGGEKVDPAEVETVLRGSGELPEVVVLGVPDAEWGQVVVAAYPGSAQPDFGRVEQWIKSHLPAYKRPKHFVPVALWPAGTSGKVNRPEVARLVRTHMT